MPNLNRVMLMGNLTRDPEVRYTPKGTCIAGVGLAINRKWKAEDGEMKEEVTFVDCTAFGRTAEVIGQYLKKGKPIFFEGRLKLDEWDDKQTGKKRQKLGVVIESFQFVETGGGDGGSSERRPAAPKDDSRQPTTKRSGGGGGHDYSEPETPPVDDDVPF